jgi:cytochrome P450
VTDVLDALMTSPELLVRPQWHFAALRAMGPVVRGEHDTQLCRRVDVEWALRHHELFAAIDAVDLGGERPTIPLSVDPPEQRKYRRLLDPWFAPSEMAKREPAIRRLVNDLIDGFAARGSVDFSNEFAIPLPSQVFLELVGMPLSDRPFLLTLKEGLLRPEGATDEERMANKRRTGRDVYAYFNAILDERTREPRGDLLSRFLVSEIEGQRLTRENILDICYLILTAGLDTITNTLECSFATLAQRPDLREQIVADPSIIPSAIEELLRWESVVQIISRRATEPRAARAAHRVPRVASAHPRVPPAVGHRPDVHAHHARRPQPHPRIHRCLGRSGGPACSSRT